MLTATASQIPQRPALHEISVNPNVFQDLYSDFRDHGPQGPSRTVRFPRATSNGGGTISKSEDGLRCVVAGKESLRILKLSDSSQPRDPSTDHKVIVGRGGARIEASRNLWEGSGLKIDSANTDVVWGHGSFSNKILTSARNGEIIMWDLNKNGTSKYERRTRDHTRSIHKLAYSQIVQNYCLTGSADGDIRIWDLRDLSKSVLKIHHPTSVRALAFSPSQTNPLHTLVGLENGSIYRWDLKSGQRGQLDRLPVAHAGAILALNWFPGALDREVSPSTPSEGWVATGGLDRCVKVWNFNLTSGSHNQPFYTLHTPFAVRRLIWRPSYECELAIVSNADFGIGSGSDLAAGSKLPSPRISELPFVAEPSISGALDELRIHLNQKLQEDPKPYPQPNSNGEFGDSVEIWDVRRQYIAKWVVKGSAVEGGVTDVAFGDSNLLWAQHSSGAFSQMDVRHSFKPLDAVPRVATSWEVSGALAFVSERRPLYEIPYDDIESGKRQLARERQIQLKTLGHPPYLPQSQNVGSYAHDWAVHDITGFMKLARGYLVEGTDRSSICRFNANVALDAGKEDVAQTWALLGLLLTDLVPLSTPSLSPLHISNPGLHHAATAPAAIPSIHSSPSPRRDVRTASDVPGLYPRNTNANHTRQPSLTTSTNNDALATSHLTPTSSAASSPQRLQSNLPSYSPNTQFPSALLRRQSAAGLASNPNSSIARRRMSSSLRRPSMSTSGVSTELISANGSVRSHTPSLKHVGEGALDDSDYSGEENNEGSEPSSGDEPSLKPLISPYIFPKNTTAHPSPLSRLVRQQDSLSEDDEDREDSPSPVSSDSGSNSPRIPRKRRASGAQASSRKRGGTNPGNRSRSSTVASLAASSAAVVTTPPPQKPLTRKDSQISIRTVTVGNTSKRGSDAGLNKDQAGRGFVSGDTPDGPSNSTWHRHQMSEIAVSEMLLEDDDLGHDEKFKKAKPSSHMKEAIEVAEQRFRDLGWEAMREGFEAFAEEGDVQMCAVMSLIAPKELQISSWRALRFFESYIEILSRLRLHTSAAYLRKYVETEEIRVNAALQTTIYTSCGNCRKPIPYTIGVRRYNPPSGGVPRCLQCETRISRCSICHLPVKALLFYCAVCMHGGHQKCYREYYTRRPTVEIPPSLSVQESITRNPASSVGSDDGLSSENREEPVESGGDSLPVSQRHKILGHPCAAGCGHYCWVVTQKFPNS